MFSSISNALHGNSFWHQHVFSPGYDLPWESEGEGWEYPSSFAPPLQVAIEASDGASDYGNKFGEPVLSGREAYSRSSEVYLETVRKGCN